MLKPFTVICSDEILLVQEAVDLWRKKARHHGFNERDVFDVDARFQWSMLRDSLQSLSLFSDKKIIEIRLPSGKLGKEGAETLKTISGNVPSDVCMILTLPRLDKTTKSSMWFKALQSHAEFLDLANITLAQLPRFIAERLKANGQNASPAALQLMSQQFEGNLIAAHQEIQKLALLFPAGALSDDDIQKSIFNVARYDVFSLSEAILSGDVARVCRIIEGLRAEGESIILILWALTEDIRTLTAIKMELQDGGNIHHLMREKRVWGQREKNMPAAIMALSLPFLKNALTRTHELDKLAKGLVHGNVWESTLQLTSQIALRIKNMP